MLYNGKSSRQFHEYQMIEPHMHASKHIHNEVIRKPTNSSDDWELRESKISRPRVLWPLHLLHLLRTLYSFGTPLSSTLSMRSLSQTEQSQPDGAPIACQFVYFCLSNSRMKTWKFWKHTHKHTHTSTQTHAHKHEPTISADKGNK